MTWIRVKYCFILAFNFGVGTILASNLMAESTFKNVFINTFGGLAGVLLIFGVFAPIGITLLGNFVFGNDENAG